MPFWRNYYHLVWTTKNRQPLIQPDIETPLFEYLIHKAIESDVHIYAINGWTEHIHIVGAIPPKHAVASIVKRLKGASSYYLNHVVRHENWFQWQRGYGVMTLGERQLDRAIDYVHRQKKHHKQQTTNSWLEKVYEFEEGPPSMVAELSPLVAVKESSIIYQTSNENSFPF